MSKRFGRNQRRAARSRIAQLEHLLYGDWPAAAEGLFTTDLDALEPVESHVRENTRPEKSTREAWVTIWVDEGHPLLRCSMHWANWRGFNWRFDEFILIRQHRGRYQVRCYLSAISISTNVRFRL